jgi:hypothetical protein
MGLFDYDDMGMNEQHKDIPPLTEEQMKRMADNIMQKVGRYRVCPVCCADGMLVVQLSKHVHSYETCPLCEDDGCIYVIKERPRCA